jgi:Ca-activated chloride channel family protein
VRAKREILDLLDELPESKVGLVIFAGGAYPRIPQTLDHRAIETVLAATDTATIRAQGSSIAAALKEALDLMDFETESDRAIVLVSDGEGWDRDLDEMVSRVEQRGVRVYSIGVGGASGAPIPTESGFKLDRDGEMVMTRLDRTAMERLAQSTSGAYVTSVAGNSDVVGIVQEMRSAMTGASMGTRREKVWDERYQWPLALGVVVLLGSALIGRGRGAAIVGLLFLVCSGEVANATPTAVDSSDPRALWQMGEDLYISGDYEDAWSTFDDIATRSVESDVREQARYNAGLASYGSGRLEDAVADWEALLELNPEHEAAAANAEAVRQEIAQRMQPPPPESDESEPGEDGEEGEEGEESDSSEGEPESDGTRDESDAGQDTGEMPPPEEPGEEEGEMDESDSDSPDQSTGAGEELLAEGVQEISEEAAQHLLEGVEEGRPHVVVTGGSQERDW